MYMGKLKLDFKDKCYFLLCECGHENKIEESRIFHSDYTKDKTKHIDKLATDFTCQGCKKTFPKDIELELTENRLKLLKKQNLIFSIVVKGGIAVLASAFLFNAIQNKTPAPPKSPTYLDTGNPSDMTNKERQQFQEWKEKERQREWENKRVFE